MNKVELILEGLDCANCAVKIENQVKALSEVQNANMNFINKKMTIEVENKQQLAKVVEDTRKIIKRLEPHVEVIVLDKQSKGSHTHEDHEGLKASEFTGFALGVILFSIGVIFNFNLWIEFGLYFVSYILVGGEVLL
jgi:Cd2+/Zn2+-exporting ATPase